MDTFSIESGKAYRLPNVKAPDNVTGIGIVKGTGEKIMLIFTNSKWMLEPGDYFAQNSDVNEMIAQLKTFEISDLVTGGSLLNYSLDDSNRIDIMAYYSNKEVLHFYMGKTSATYRHTYVQLSGDTNVYQAKGTFYYAFNKDFDGLKSRDISLLNKDDLMQVRIKENGKEYLLKRIKSSDKSQWKASWKNTPADEVKVDAFLQKTTPLSAAALAPGKMDDKASYLRLIELKTDKEIETIYIFRQENTKEKFYIVGVKGNPVLFKITESQGKDLLKKIYEF